MCEVILFCWDFIPAPHKDKKQVVLVLPDDCNEAQGTYKHLNELLQTSDVTREISLNVPTA